MAIAWALIAFVGMVVLVWALSALATARSRYTTARLQALTSPTPPPQTAQRPGAEDRMPTITAMLGGRRVSDRLTLSLTAAGLRFRPSEFVGIAIGMVVISQIVGLAVARSILLNVALGIVGAALPFSIMNILQRKRRAAFDVQLVDALMMIASSLRAGFSFLRGMQVVAQEMPKPVSEEFERVINEVGVGRTMEEALRNMVARMQSYDLDLAVTAILIQLQVGGNLSEMLETIAGTIRERIRIYSEMRVLTAEGRLSGWVLAAIPLVLAVTISIMNPEYMSFLIVEPLGHILIATAVILQITGGLIIKRMLVLDA